MLNNWCLSEIYQDAGGDHTGQMSPNTPWCSLTSRLPCKSLSLSVLTHGFKWRGRPQTVRDCKRCSHTDRSPLFISSFGKTISPMSCALTIYCVCPWQTAASKFPKILRLICVSTASSQGSEQNTASEGWYTKVQRHAWQTWLGVQQVSVLLVQSAGWLKEAAAQLGNSPPNTYTPPPASRHLLLPRGYEQKGHGSRPGWDG